MEFSQVIDGEWTQRGETATLKEHQAALYALLLEFDRVARLLKTPYYLFAGTLLGAVRHRGFIPWDDDLDIMMKREDYERFLREAPPLVGERFFLQGEFSEHFPMFFSKLRMNGTACLEKYHPKDKDSHQGVYMDIFPCDNAWGTELGRRMQFLCSKVVIAKGLYARGYDNDKGLKKVFMNVCRLLPLKPFLAVVQHRGKPSAYLHSFLGGARRYDRNVYQAAWFEGTKQVPFEGGMFSAPVHDHELLTAIYGDYMQIPPEEDRGIKEHCILVDLKHDYKHYEHYREGMKWDVYTRSIR